MAASGRRHQKDGVETVASGRWCQEGGIGMAASGGCVGMVASGRWCCTGWERGDGSVGMGAYNLQREEMEPFLLYFEFLLKIHLFHFFQLH